MKTFNFIRKTFIYRDIPSSGVMCLLSIIKYHNGYKDPAYLLFASKTTNGITLLPDLAKAAETIGLSTITGSSTLDNLKKFPNPVILHIRNDWGEYDFVVCYGYNRNCFLVGVPSWGLMEFREDEMDVLWESRLILYLEPTNSFKKNIKKNANIDLSDKNTAQQSLSDLTIGLSNLPANSFSIDHDSMKILVNDISTNNRSSILEFGSGLSTIIIANLLKKYAIKARFYSVESDKFWFTVVENSIRDNKLHKYINLIYAPLEPIPYKGEFPTLWYKISNIEKVVANKKFDMVIVDGPPAFRKEIELSRYPALFFVVDKLKTHYSLFLHDTDREGERTILNNWEQELKIKSQLFTQKLSGFIV